MQATQEKSLFLNYTRLPTYLSIRAWNIVRVFSVLFTLGFCFALFWWPASSLHLLWSLLFPCLPLLFLLAPGIWRNICPLAAVNQVPRLFRFTKGLEQTQFLKSYSYVIGITLFFILVSSRKFLFNYNSIAAALLILAALLLAFSGGLIFKGKSGWCSTVCPLLPVQRLYGQTPYLIVANSHCQPCVACTKNCYDFNPTAAYFADQYDEDRQYAGYRRFFAAAFPGFILAYYLIPNPPIISIPTMYLHFAYYMAISIAIFSMLSTFIKSNVNTYNALFAAAAFNIYYWFNAQVLLQSIAMLMHRELAPWTFWLFRAGILAITLIWVFRTFIVERKFIAHTILAASAKTGKLASVSTEVIAEVAKKKRPIVRIMPENTMILAEQGEILLNLIEHCGLPIEAGCRLGLCGADPVAIIEGSAHIPPADEDEQSTLSRLGYAPNTRMACCVRIEGNMSVGLIPEKGEHELHVIEGAQYDPSVKDIVIIGNGIAGITAADYIRRYHPNCAINIIGREKYLLYNRMSITRLIYGRSAMHGLNLLPDEWCEKHNINCWLNTRAEKIDLATHQVYLATGEQLHYDRLIIATGSSSFVPEIEKFGIAGSFVLREADDAMHIRDYAQRYHTQHAVIAGGGLLGLETAYAIHKMGIDVTALERSAWLLPRQLDQKCALLLMNYLDSLGIKVITEAEIATLVEDNNRVSSVILKNGNHLPCDIFIVCVGIKPNIALAQDAGIKVRRGIVVDDLLRTSVKDVFAVGDVAEYAGNVYGLWPAAVEQAEIAALNAIGNERLYHGTLPVTILKVVGADLMSIGRIEPQSENDEVIIFEDPVTNHYRKLIIADNKIVGAILFGYPHESIKIEHLFKDQTDIRNYLNVLRSGNWMDLNVAIKEKPKLH